MQFRDLKPFAARDAQNVDEKLDAAIEPVLTKQTFRKGGQLLLRLNDQPVPYSYDFRFYITTKLANPHYLPEIFVKVTIINFTVTEKGEALRLRPLVLTFVLFAATCFAGLEDQLLVALCEMERPDLEEKNENLMKSISDDRNELSMLEDTILDLIQESKVS